jgi:uncharacterized protein (TIGR00297 family)
MVLALLPAVIGAAATGALSASAVVARALTPIAGAVAAAFGIAIVVAAGFPYLALLVLFVVGTSLATRFRFDEKRQVHLQEGAAGERGVANVVAHILIPSALAVGGGLAGGPSPVIAVLYASALSFGAADTFASEFGVLAGTARSILSARPVSPGTNGGVSGIGEAFALAGAVVTAGIGISLFFVFSTPVGSPLGFLVTVSVAGFLGCQLDSVLGETLENRGYLTKGSTNFLGMLGTVAIAALVATPFGIGL